MDSGCLNLKRLAIENKLKKYAEQKELDYKEASKAAKAVADGLNEQNVGTMIKAIEKDRARLIMPPIVYSMYPLRLLPPLIFDKVTAFFGVSKSMDDFVGYET